LNGFEKLSQGKPEPIALSDDFADFTYKSGSERAVSRVEDFLWSKREEFLVKDLYFFFGEGDATTIIVLSKEDLPDEELKTLRKKVRGALPPVPGAKVYFREEAEEGGSTTYFAVKLYGNDLEGLNRWAEVVAGKLEAIEEVEDVNTSARNAWREIQARLDSDRARKLGLAPQDMADAFAFTLGGLRLPRFNAGDREVEVNLSLTLEDRENLADLRQLVVRSAEGRPVQLGDVASFEVVPRAQTLERENRKIRVVVRASFDGKSFGPTREEISETMNALGLPPGMTWSFNDRIQEQSEQGKTMALNFLLALVLVYVLMASLLESVSQPFAILFAVPFSLVGASWFLALTGTPFNLMANMGVLILMGIVVNNGIVLLDRVNQYRRSGLNREEATLRAGRDRLRPILMTALTTVLGLLPLALGKSGVGGWAYYYPLARTVMGGLISSTVLTLVVLPYINHGIENAATWARRGWAGSAPRTAPQPAR